MNRSFSIFTIILTSIVAFLFTSCQIPVALQTDTSSPGYSDPRANTGKQVNPIKPTDVGPTSEIAETPIQSNLILKTEQIEVTKLLLQSASVGDEALYRIRVRAFRDIGTVRINETIPEGVEFQSATPSASLSGNEASWTFPSMRSGQVQSIDVFVKPLAEGDHQICSNVSIDNPLCLNLFAGQPKLTIEKKGPASVELGGVITWNVQVSNNGSASATNVVVIDKMPDAFEPISELRQSIDTLGPNETQTLEYSAKAIIQGEFENHVVASYSGGPDNAAESRIPIKIVQSGIRVSKVGPEEGYVFKPVVFEIVIENTGDTDLKNVHITDILPRDSRIIDNGLGRVNGNAIGWMIPNLPAGSSQVLTTEISSNFKGKSTSTVKVLTENGLQARDSLTTNWLAVPGVSVSISDSKDPIRIKERATYTITVNNQGKFEPVSGTVTVTFNDSIKPITVTGDARGSIDGQTVTFPRTTLEPGKDTLLNIIAEGVETGTGRAVLNFSADFLAEPIVSQQTTNVY